MASKAIDISKWNGNVDFDAVKDIGIEYVLIQCGYGMAGNQKDPYFEKNYKNAKKAGLKVGVYHYSYATSVSEIKKEAKLCLSWLKGKTLDMPVYIDMEEDYLAYLGKSTLTKMAMEFCKMIETKGFLAGVYANANWFRNYLNHKEIKGSYSVWLAQYASQKDFDCDIWQYSDSGRIKNNAAFFDMNYVYKIPVINVKLKKNAGLYTYAYNDPVGKSSVAVKTLKKGTTVRWLYDDNFGWSKVQYGDKQYFVVNSRLNRKGLSSYPKEKLKRDTKVYVESKGKLSKAKILKKGKTVTVLCTVEKGKFKGYDYLHAGVTRYYRK